VTRSSGSSVRRTRPALGFRRVCADIHARFAVFPLRPSSDGATRRRSSLAVQPSSGFLPGRLARLRGRLSWVSSPRASAHFQRGAREPSPACDVPPEELARALAACRRLLPRGLPAVGDGRLRATSLALSVLAAEVACARRFRVSFAVGGRFLLRSRDPLPRSLVRRRTARRKRPYARADPAASTSHVVHSRRHARLHFLVRRLGLPGTPSKSFHTAIHSLWKARAATNDVAHSHHRTRAKPHAARLSAIQRG